MYSSKPMTKLNVISCNFANFSVIFMKFSTKCNTRSDIGKFVINLGISISVWEKKKRADYQPHIYPMKIPTGSPSSAFT